jgi:hypothetical protein
MVKICPNCKTENVDTAEFCENCGTELGKPTYSTPAGNEDVKPKDGNWWSKQTSLVKILSVVGVCCVGLIVIIGLIAILFPDATTFNLDTGSVSDLKNTFSQDGLTFKYPDWQTTSSQSDIVSSGSNVNYLTTLYSSDGLTLHVSDVDTSGYGYNVEQVKDITKTNIQASSSAKLLSDTKTTVNGLNVYELIFTITDPNTNKENKLLYAVTGKEGAKVYYLQFIGETSVFDSNKKVIDNIISTIQVT